MGGEKLPKLVMKWCPPVRRKRGGPTVTWAEGIKGMMGEKGLMEEDRNNNNNEKGTCMSIDVTILRETLIFVFSA